MFSFKQISLHFLKKLPFFLFAIVILHKGLIYHSRKEDKLSATVSKKRKKNNASKPTN